MSMAAEAERDFDSHGWGTRRWLCSSIGGFNSWDVNGLHSDPPYCPNPWDVPGCPSPGCECTVEMFGACVKSYEANYFLWGVMNRLCGRTIEDATGDTYTWKTWWYGNAPSPGTTWATYRGFKHTQGREREYTNHRQEVAPGHNPCETGCGKYKGYLTWNWGGMSGVGH